MINILDIDLEYIMVNDFKGCEDASLLFHLCYYDENGVPHIVFYNIELFFKNLESIVI